MVKVMSSYYFNDCNKDVRNNSVNDENSANN